MPPAVLRPPAIAFNGVHRSSDEVAALAEGWLDDLRASMPAADGPIALALSNHPEAIALFFALSTFPVPLIVLPPDPRAWRSSPPIPPGTPLVLPPPLRATADAGRALGLRTIVAPDARPASRAVGTAPFLATPGIVHFTSGSTGLPKPVYVLTRSFVQQAEAIIEACALASGASVAGSVPLTTSYGLARGLFLPTVLGARLGLLDRFDHRALLQVFASARYDYWAGTPLMASLLARAPLDGPCPAVPPICHVSTGALPEPVFRAFRERFGVPLRPGYGQTENGFITVDTAPAEHVRPDGVGRAAPGIEVRIGDDPLAPFPHGRTGRVWFTSDRYMEGYGFPPRLAPREHRHGWWPTSDLGRLDERGYLTLAGRADDCFKTSAGYLVSPAEIANALISHPAVTDVAVVAVPGGSDALIGALVESAAGAGELRAVAARTLAPWLRPAIVVVTGQLPRLPGGKVDLSACRAVLAESRGRREPAATFASPDG